MEYFEDFLWVARANRDRDTFVNSSSINFTIQYIHSSICIRQRINNLIWWFYLMHLKIHRNWEMQWRTFVFGLAPWNNLLIYSSFSTGSVIVYFCIQRQISPTTRSTHESLKPLSLYSKINIRVTHRTSQNFLKQKHEWECWKVHQKSPNSFQPWCSPETG